jgi:GNAT superfamily N-acetyltransferase
MTHTAQNLRIVHLVEAREIIPTLAKWFVEEWAPYYGPDGPGVAEEDLMAYCNRDQIPTALVAFDAESNVVGTAALKADSVGSELGQGPWLAAFLVGKHHRGKGVGTALVEAIEREACRLGFQTIYTSTDAAEGIYRRRGWRALNQVSSLRGPITVYKQDLDRH